MHVCGTLRVRQTESIRFYIYFLAVLQAQLDYTRSPIRACQIIHTKAARRQQPVALGSNTCRVCGQCVAVHTVLFTYWRTVCEYDRTTSAGWLAGCDSSVCSTFTYDRVVLKNTYTTYFIYVHTAQFSFFSIKVFSVINFVAISRNNRVIGVTSNAIDIDHTINSSSQFAQKWILSRKQRRRKTLKILNC